MLSICRTFEFEAAHYLPNHLGKCRNLHGHSYKLEVEFVGETCPNGDAPEYGMLEDFGNVKKFITDNVIDKLDHTVLNDVAPFYPTAENLVIWIKNEIQFKHNLRCKLARIRLWETSTSWAEWRNDDL